MKSRIERLWEEISTAARSRPIDEGTYILKRVDPELRFDVYAGVDSSGYVMLAIGVRRVPPPIKLESVALDYFRQQRVDGTWLMALRLKQPFLAPVFGRLCQDLIDATTDVADEIDLLALTRERLTLWTKLFAQASGGQLEPYQVKGLMAELLLLESLLSAAIRSPLELVTAWQGPSKADQDFLFQDEAIEVKAISPESEDVSISSLQQLLSPLPLRLNVQTLRPAAPGESGALSLNLLVPRLEGQLARSPDALALFRARTLEAGYLESPYYDTILFHPLATEDFRVTDHFPRLTSENVPRGVASASYTLSLNILRGHRR